MSRRWRRQQCRRRPHSCCCNATAPVTVAAPKRVPAPTKHPGDHPTHAPNRIPQPGEYPPYPNGPNGGVDTSAPPCSVVTNPTNTHIARNPNVASRDVENRSNDRFDIPARVPKEGGRWGKRGGGVGERKEGLRGDKPHCTPNTAQCAPNTMGMQAHGQRRTRRQRHHRRCRHHQNDASTDASSVCGTPTSAPAPAQRAPPKPKFISDNAHTKARPKRRRRHRRHHPDGASNAPSPRTTANSVGKPDHDICNWY